VNLNPPCLELLERHSIGTFQDAEYLISHGARSTVLNQQTAYPCSARRADRDPPLWTAEMAGYAFGSNPPLRTLSGKRPSLAIEQHSSPNGVFAFDFGAQTRLSMS
jgi:hypothetical protein